MRLLLLRKFVCDFDLGDIGNVGQSVGFDLPAMGSRSTSEAASRLADLQRLVALSSSA